MREVRFALLTLNEEGERSALRELTDVPVLHWHGDTFELPEGAARLASTGAYVDRAFAVGDHALGLQFHADMGEDARFVAWMEQDADYIRDAGVEAAAL